MKWLIFLVSISLSGPMLASTHLPVIAEFSEQDMADAIALADDLMQEDSKIPFKERLRAKIEKAKEENPRLVGALLTVALGPFGAHRIYLGTETRVPVFYTLTLGGGLGVLPAIDLFCILFTKDLDRYYANDQIFMWSGG
jgi:TM2 domain-containing membrane protein YozV